MQPGWGQEQSIEEWEPTGAEEEEEESRDLCVERVAAREQRETARPIIDGALLGEQGLEFSRHFQHISLLFKAARCNAQSAALDRVLSPPRINKVGFLSLHEYSIKVIKGWK